jgi:hypothetical protein
VNEIRAQALHTVTLFWMISCNFISCDICPEILSEIHVTVKWDNISQQCYLLWRHTKRVGCNQDTQCAEWSTVVGPICYLTGWLLNDIMILLKVSTGAARRCAPGWAAEIMNSSALWARCPAVVWTRHIQEGELGVDGRLHGLRGRQT